MDTNTDTSSEPKNGRITLAGLLVLVENIQRDVAGLSDQINDLRRDSMDGDLRLEGQIREVASRAEVIASGLDEVVARMAPPAPAVRPAEVAPKPELRDGGSVRFIGRELTIPRPGAANGAKLTIRHRDVFSGETAAYLREHHPDLVEPYPRARAE